MSRESDICVVGACNLDLISYVPRLPRMGETLHGTRFHMGYGGKGANQAVMAAKLGGRVAMVAKVGDDVFGKDMIQNFQRWGVDASHVHVTDRAPSGVAPIAVDGEGRNSIIIVTGANDLLTPEDVEAARQIIAGSRVLVCQLEIPVATTVAALRIAREQGIRSILNPAPARSDLPDDIYDLCDIVCPNESETELLSGMSVDSLEEAEAAGRALLERGVGTVILTLGERGSLLINRDEGATHAPVAPVEAIDSTGAGDAFVGSLAFFLASGRDMLDAMGRANRIAASSVLASGTQTSFPEARDLPPDLME